MVTAVAMLPKQHQQLQIRAGEVRWLRRLDIPSAERFVRRVSLWVRETEKWSEGEIWRGDVKWEEGEKKDRIKGDEERVRACECRERGKGRQIEILIVPSFLQAHNVIKGIIDLVLILPSGCYLFLQHDERSPFCWWNAQLFLEILVPKQHVLLYSNVLPQWQQNPNTSGSDSYHPTVSKTSWYTAVTRKTFRIQSAMCKNFSWKILKRGLKWGGGDRGDIDRS